MTDPTPQNQPGPASPPLPASELEISMLRAFRPGDVVFVRLTCPIPADAQVHLAEWMARVRESTGIHVVILDHDMEIMGAQVQGPTLVQGSERHGQAEGAGT